MKTWTGREMVLVKGFRGRINWKKLEHHFFDGELLPNRGYVRVPDVKLYVGPFWISAEPISNAEFCSFLDLVSRLSPTFQNVIGMSFWEEHRALMEANPLSPVRYVSWEEALMYCLLAGGRLPSDEEYQVASLWALRSGETTGGDVARNLFKGPGVYTLTPSSDYFEKARGELEYVQKFEFEGGLLHPGLATTWEVFRKSFLDPAGWSYGRSAIGFRLVFDKARHALRGFPQLQSIVNSSQ